MICLCNGRGFLDGEWGYFWVDCGDIFLKKDWLVLVILDNVFVLYW